MLLIDDIPVSTPRDIADPGFTVTLTGKPEQWLLEAFHYGEVRKWRVLEADGKSREFEAYISAICDHVPSGRTSIELKYAT